MKIHEYQGKEILRNFGVPVPRGIPAFTVQEAVEAAQKLGGPVWVVKAQIHAGGRGKGGGVKLARSVDEVKKLAGEILGMQLKTHQTGPEGQKVRRLLHRGRRRHQEGILRFRGDRPRLAEGGVHGLQRRRHGHRGSGACHAGEDHQGVRRPARRPHRRPGQGTRRRHRRPRRLHRPGRGRAQEALQGATWTPTPPGRDQPADPAKATATSRRWTPSSTSTPTRCSAIPRSWRCATWTRKTRPKSRPASSTWPTSAWTATSAAWSTAPAWPWRPWTPSSCSAASPPTSSTWAAAPLPRR